ncbi:MAG TPA: hypothetical protein VN461_12475 [Vicinamibacteria bacterium]|jgi:hypothetical protein|nr:hypothetical protein [Vicinamibacteria bacterium]
MRTHKLTAVDGSTVVLLEPEDDADAAALEADDRVDKAVLFSDHRLREGQELVLLS